MATPPRGGRLCRRCRRARVRCRQVEPTAPTLPLKSPPSLVPGHYSLTSCLSPAERGHIYEQIPRSSTRTTDKSSGGLLRKFRELFVSKKPKEQAPTPSVPHVYYEPVEWTASAPGGEDSDYASSPVLTRALRASKDHSSISSSSDSGEEPDDIHKCPHLALKRWSSHEELSSVRFNIHYRQVPERKSPSIPGTSRTIISPRSPGSTLEKGGMVNILEQSQSGLWLGEVNGRLRYFQCVDVEDEGRAELKLLLSGLRLEGYLEVLVKNGFDGPDTFMCLDSGDLDLMRIWDPGHRRALLGAACRLRHPHGPEESGQSDSGVHSSSLDSTYV